MICFSFFAVFFLSFAAFSLITEMDGLNFPFESTNSGSSGTSNVAVNLKPKSCQDISRTRMPPLKAFTAVGLWPVYWTLDTMFNSSVLMFSNGQYQAIDGSSNTGTIIIAEGSCFITLDVEFHEYYANTTNCNRPTDGNVTWFMHKSLFSSNGSYHFVISCKGDRLENVVVASTSSKFEKELYEDLWALKGVPGYDEVHSARINTCDTIKNIQCVSNKATTTP